MHFEGWKSNGYKTILLYIDFTILILCTFLPIIIDHDINYYYYYIIHSQCHYFI